MRRTTMSAKLGCSAFGSSKGPSERLWECWDAPSDLRGNTRNWQGALGALGSVDQLLAALRRCGGNIAHGFRRRWMFVTILGVSSGFLERNFPRALLEAEHLNPDPRQEFLTCSTWKRLIHTPNLTS